MHGLFDPIVSPFRELFDDSLNNHLRLAASARHFVVHRGTARLMHVFIDPGGNRPLERVLEGDVTMADISAFDTSPQPRVVRVALPAGVAYDLGKFQQVQKDILGRLGCLACCSGWDIRWDILRDFRVDEKLRVEQGFLRG